METIVTKTNAKKFAKKTNIGVISFESIKTILRSSNLEAREYKKKSQTSLLTNSVLLSLRKILITFPYWF
jgi:hypothetical protein